MTNPLAPLAALRQFIAVRLVPLPDGKTDKLPLTPAGELTPKGDGGAHNPAYWTSWAEAHALATRLGPNHTVGFVITAGCGFACLDIDGCIQPDGTYTQIVHDLASQLGTHVAWEASLSGTGLHLWMRTPAGGLAPHGKKNTALHLELYDELRFIAMGRAFHGDMDQPCPGLPAVAARYFPEAARGEAQWDPDYRHPDWVGPPLSDEEVVRLCGAIKSPARVFGSKATFQELMQADPDVLARHFPSSTDAYDRSSADLALFSDLAWATGHNAAQMVRIARTSGLARDKWDRDDYVQSTVARGCAGSGCYKAKVSAAVERAVTPSADSTVSAPAPKVADGTTTPFATREDQLKLFAGHVYVLDQHRVLTPKGLLLKPDQFRALYGGVTFLMGGSRNKTTNNAWEAFTENQDITFPRADSTCFRPEHPFGHIIEDDGVRRVNTYLPPNVRAVPGDAGPFLRHLHTLLPNGDDAEILLSYLAACVQYPGHKFPWAPVIQGVEGNGKTLLSIAVAYAVGKRYTHWPKASKLVKQFNGWMVGKLLYCVEDIYMPGPQGDLVLEEMKPMITGGRGIEIESKGVDQVSADICGNFVINTNHLDGVRKKPNDRRYCMLYCAQQEASDLTRDFGGDVEGYMRRLYHWLDDEDGLAICAHYLQTYAIPERFDPTKGAQRAPRTSSHEAAVEAGRGLVEQVVLEAIEENRVGFKGGWVSSYHLRLLLESVRKDNVMSPQRRHAMMKTLGYVAHPGLPRGRVPNPVSTDSGYPILFVRPGSAECLVGSTPSEVAAAYVAAQTG